MRRKKQKKINFIQVVWDFLKLQVAANILFVSTLMGFLIGDKVLHTPQLPTLIVASIIGNILFFIIDRDWVFTKKGAKYSKWAIQKFIIFMSFNFVLNILLIEFFGWVLRTTPDASHTIILFTIWDFATGWIGPFIGSNLSNNWEMYVAQFLSGFVFGYLPQFGNMLRLVVTMQSPQEDQTGKEIILVKIGPKNQNDRF